MSHTTACPVAEVAAAPWEAPVCLPIAAAVSAASRGVGTEQPTSHPRQCRTSARPTHSGTRTARRITSTMEGPAPTTLLLPYSCLLLPCSCLLLPYSCLLLPYSWLLLASAPCCCRTAGCSCRTAGCCCRTAGCCCRTAGCCCRQAGCRQAPVPCCTAACCCRTAGCCCPSSWLLLLLQLAVHTSVCRPTMGCVHSKAGRGHPRAFLCCCAHQPWATPPPAARPPAADSAKAPLGASVSARTRPAAESGQTTGSTVGRTWLSSRDRPGSTRADALLGGADGGADERELDRESASALGGLPLVSPMLPATLQGLGASSSAQSA